MAIITPEGKWEHETDNSQGSVRIRFDSSKKLQSVFKVLLGVGQKNMREENFLNIFLNYSAQRTGQ